jgi:hypothetical protein
MKKQIKNLTATELDALEHIKRNGNLLWWEGSGREAEKMFCKLKDAGYIVHNIWSDKWQVV